MTDQQWRREKLKELRETLPSFRWRSGGVGKLVRGAEIGSRVTAEVMYAPTGRPTDDDPVQVLIYWTPVRPLGAGQGNGIKAAWADLAKELRLWREEHRNQVRLTEGVLASVLRAKSRKSPKTNKTKESD